MRALLLGVLLVSGCEVHRLQTHIDSQVCIIPYHKYSYLTCSPIVFRVESQRFTIPAHFKTDLASIPRILWPALSPAHSSTMPAAIVHDWLYRKTCDFNRRQTDLIFYSLLQESGVNRFKAAMMYYAVRLFGWPFYNEDYCE